MEEFQETYDTVHTPEESQTSTSSHTNDREPGAARQGNFINYYQFNPPSERLSLLFPNKLFNNLEIAAEDTSLVCLDVGCNSGVSKKF